MDGITDCAYRLVVQEIFEKYNKENELWMWTEFMNADGYTMTPPRLVKHMMKTPEEQPVFAQIYGGNKDTLIKAAVDIEKKYGHLYAGIELNIGCPSPKVMSCGGGSGMMKDKANTLDIIKGIHDAISMPFSIKTRAGLTEDDKQAQYQFMVDAAPYCHTISVHGRTFKQSHSGGVDWQQIYDLKKELGDTCKVIGNGGITSYEDALEHLGNLDGIMIGQHAIANPWLLTPHTPSIQDRYDVTMRHLELLAASEIYFKEFQYGEFTPDDFKNHKDPETLRKAEIYKLKMPTLEILEEYIHKIPDCKESLRTPIEFRKFLFNYVKTIPGGKDFKIAIAHTKSYTEIETEIHKFFKASIENY